MPTGRDYQFAWFSSDCIREEQLKLQRHFERFPGTKGYYQPDCMSKGELVTLEYLWENREEVEMIAAILISSSLFPYVKSSRYWDYYPRDAWPPQYCVEAVYEFVINKWCREKITPQYPWHYSCTVLLPQINMECRYKKGMPRIDNLSDLIKHLADIHSATLCEYKPVFINFTPKRDPFIEKILAEEYTRNQKWQLKQLQLQKEKRSKQEQRKKEHPRWGEWPISNDELKKLVWSMPTVDVAKLFGISDVAVAKKCKSNGIPKPPVGFWAKVKAGKIPHPKGVPYIE